MRPVTTILTDLAKFKQNCLVRWNQHHLSEKIGFEKMATLPSLLGGRTTGWGYGILFKFHIMCRWILSRSLALIDCKGIPPPPTPVTDWSLTPALYNQIGDSIKRVKQKQCGIMSK